MPKRSTAAQRDPDTTDDAVLARLRKHLEFLGLTLTLRELDARLAWATQERPSITDLLDHIFGEEAAHKLEQRIGRRIDTSGLTERKMSVVLKKRGYLAETAALQRRSESERGSRSVEFGGFEGCAAE